jgi:hypothetical protein
VSRAVVSVHRMPLPHEELTPVLRAVGAGQLPVQGYALIARV